ncbi:E3 ubiquitin-protein ligase RNF113A [Diorhabda sublineata]|uniref:E3 ubiquitin-protein ligase RNF113A n=1 Tax=Diorhabda sublineata TaxID=1163346 RepID=UPI0024E0A264|nr:E3 ubiquitin-protein ligase RNF113A [Diorhabda sublineata]
MESSSDVNCKFIFKKRTIKNRGTRKRQASSSEEDQSENEDQQQCIVKQNKRKLKSNPNIHTTNNLQKRQTNIDTEKSNSSDEDFRVNYKSNRSAMSAGPSDQGATATVEIDTERDRDAQAIFEKRLEINKDLEGKEDDKIYRGLNNYTQYYKPKDTAAGNASSGMVRKGPIRAPANLRATVRWDYQPDICKDYKETGFCGFGDSCKFLHDRSDYKHGWQLEREWNEGNYSKDSDDDTRYEIHSDEEDLPFKCLICRGSFVDPVVSKCKHYFCEKCALERFKKNKKCIVCNKLITSFNPANNLIAKLKNIKSEEDNRQSDSSD